MSRFKHILYLVLITLVLVSLSPAHSAYRYDFDDTRWVSFGGGLRTSFNNIEDRAPNSDDSKDFEIDNFRLYFNGQVHEYVKFQINTERDRARDDLRLLDGIIKFQFHDAFNIWAGRQKLASDRGNLNSAFTIVPYDRISIRRFANEFAGRDDGVSIWGKVANQRLKYYVQAFDGAPDRGDDLLFVGRLSYSFLDKETGFTNSGSYFGKKDILTVAASVLSENSDDGWTLDALYENNLGAAGVITLEGAYFNYNDLANSNNVAVNGDAWFLQAAYRTPEPVGIGHIQPFIRHQDADFDNANGDRLDIGINYLISDFNALLTVMWARDDNLGIAGEEFDIVRIGAQVQF